MLKPQEKKIITQLLDLVSEPEDLPTLKSFEGFMFGLAMTPDVILPSEWLPFILGEEGPEFESEKQAQEMLNCVMRIYNRLVSDFQNGRLTLPLQLDEMISVDLSGVHDWVDGLTEALWLRDEIWDFDGYDHLTDEEKDLLYTCLTSIEAFGSEDLKETLVEAGLEELFQELTDDRLQNKLSQSDKIDILLISFLPKAVSALIEHAYTLDQQIRKSMSSSQGPRLVQGKKTGRNQPCPCGSGKKYKKCCERKDDPAVKSNLIEVDFSRNRKKQRQSGELFQLKITLKGARPPIWRRIQIPGRMTLATLHHVIQECFGWEDYHLHEFVIDKARYVPADEPDDFHTSFSKPENEEAFTLQEVIYQEGQKFEYVYDFGDNWQHMISVEKILPPDKSRHHPVLLTGKRACPPEDCGGIPGFLDMLETLQEPDSPEKEELHEWLGEEFDPARFGKKEIEEINLLLRQFT